MSNAGHQAVSGEIPPEQRARANLYSLLAALLRREPTAELLQVVRELDPGEGELQEIWRQLRDTARQLEPEDVEREYQRLFIGLGRGELVPYGSHYLSGFLMEKPLADLRTDLAGMGLERQEGISEPEDHVAALCEVMAMIIQENSLSFEDETGFFKRHMGGWMPTFFQDLQQAESGRLYRALGCLGQRFMEIEQVYFRMPT